ncbi:MAG: hypothetical protein HN509_09370 [Halobacteriovoraceae bacterium]|nr:hypothetical protein [Halobacteriovoraceae bacterium]MBT5093656.1 hypothetical protein [Halobacteriovoraceae bacterium]
MIFLLPLLMVLAFDKLVLPQRSGKRRPAGLKDQLALLQKASACSKMINRFFLSTSQGLWDRAALNSFVNQPRFLLKAGEESKYALGDLALVNNNLPKVKTSYFSEEQKTLRTIEEWTQSAIIKVPYQKQGVVDFENIHAGVVHPGREFFYHNQTVGMGISSKKEQGFYQLFFKNPPDFPEYRQKLIFSDILANTDSITDNAHAGHFLNIDNSTQIGVFPLKNLNNPNLAEALPENIQGLTESYFSFFHKEYSARFKLDPRFLELLVEGIAELKDRTVTIFTMEGGLVGKFGDKGLKVSSTKKPKIKGAFSYVISSSPEEALPFEKIAMMVAKDKNPRLSAAQLKEVVDKIGYKREPGKIYAEFTRLAVDREYKEVAPDVIQMLAASAKGSKADTMVIYVDPFHKRMFSKFGFKLKNTYTDEFGEIFHVMDAEPDSVLKHVMESYHPGKLADDDFPDAIKHFKDFKRQ